MKSTEAQRGLFEAMYELGIATGMLLSSLLNLLLQARELVQFWM